MMETDISDFREFNRFHTRLVGALNEHLLASEYTLPQVRVLYEIANAPPKRRPSARDLSETLGMDPGYLSRIVSRFVDDRLVERRPSERNAKRLELTLTGKGRTVFAGLDQGGGGTVRKPVGDGKTRADRRYEPHPAPARRRPEGCNLHPA